MIWEQVLHILNRNLQNAIAEYLDKSVSFYDGGTEDTILPCPRERKSIRESLWSLSGKPI